MAIKNLLLFVLLLLFANANAQQNDRFWSPANDATIFPVGKRQIIPQKYLSVHLNTVELKNKLFSAPHENNVKINLSTCIITLPLPNGTMQQFKVVESPIMEPGLAVQFPEFKTFSIKGIDDVYASGKLDWNEFGFHGMVRSANGDFFIDPFCVENITDYITYYTKDFVKDPSQVLPEAGVVEHLDKTQGENLNSKKKGEGFSKHSNVPSNSIGDELRTYRFAVACTGEYAVAATGSSTPTKAQTLAKIVTSINRVNGVYETEVAVRLVLVATETLIIFTSASTDPFSGNNNANILILESQSVITNTIGSANFDIGHTFSTGGGGFAGLGVVCINAQKAGGITGSPSPVGDPYDIDYVAHEVGHQFAGNHTFNSTVGSCGGGNRNPGTAVEPGSGITIMGYAGICGSQNLAPNSIAYFHAISFDEIVNFTYNGAGNTCPITSTTGNQPPVVTGSGNFIIPKNTAFSLTGSATDPDGDALTYSWEETELGTAGNWNANVKPYFRSYEPVTIPTRFFPNATVLASSNYTATKGEYVPQSAQNLQFRLTARDNKTGGGGVAFAINNVTVNASGPFVLTYPTAFSIIWGSETQQTITWNENGTTLWPILADSVRILISLNGGTTYSVINNSTANDGAELITVPTVSTTISTCRIKIEAKGNIFFDVSNNNFTISNSIGFPPVTQNNPVGLAVWPNPSEGKIYFTAGNLNQNALTVLKVIDVLGKTVYSEKYSNKSELNESVDLSGLSNGIYFVSITNNNKSAVYRIIKD